jgi:ribosomal protein S27AE
MTARNYELHIENIKKGDWFVITGDKYVEADRQDGYQIPHSMRPVHSGHPFEVLCVQAPFIVARAVNVYEPTAFDIRRFAMAKVPPAYAEAYVPAGRVFYGLRRPLRGRRLGDGKPDLCPRCGCELLSMTKDGDPRWVCSAKCGFVGMVKSPDMMSVFSPFMEIKE